MAACAGAVMATQFQGYLLSILFCGRFARSVHWDRSGRWSRVEHPGAVFEFFTRFGWMTGRRRGAEVGVRPATVCEVGLRGGGWGFFSEFSCSGDANRSRVEGWDIETQMFFHLCFGEEAYIAPVPHCEPADLCPFGRGDCVAAATGKCAWMRTRRWFGMLCSWRRLGFR